MPKEKSPIACPRCGNAKERPAKGAYVERLDADGSLHSDCGSCGYLMVYRTGPGFRRLVHQAVETPHMILIEEQNRHTR